ncbi:KH domain-containing protein [Lentisphaerota bacterium ZTH]|nr:KH domain-containing protein [Lentisphaerota bacterium]WET06150.1 KH domain-containing protein [Lentisphaerota bacterium ZTH]
MLKSFLKLFAGGNADSSTLPADKGMRDLESFVDYIVRALVDQPDAVRVSSEIGKDSNVIKIDCKKEDVGKIVGKRGKTIMAIRSLVSGAAGRLKKRVTVEVVD